ncbi:hypothetical protein BKA70DRAFT_190269 [Coprinopsis sp. MPI-PUGE-AT-0042]|nr:hypothetical protein BKA70DRAFT_190269 [Coprinopsis sp. MPI-PUGE-AT-0042]
MSSKPYRPEGLAASLPIELLISILRTILPSVMDEDGRRQFQLLRMVCSHWRTVCFSTPIFWASIAFRSDGYETGNIFYENLVSRMRRWFSRAGALIPLTLSFEDEDYSYDEEEDELIKLIQEKQRRWRYLSLDIDAESFWHVLPICPPDQWTNLQYLGMSDNLIDIQDHEAESEDVRLENHPLADLFPAVKEISVYTDVGMSPMMYPASRNTVERLTWRSGWLDPAYLAPFISKYRLLTHLNLHFRYDPPDAPDVRDHIVVECLQALAFSATLDSINWEFLGRFRAPVLRELALTLLTGSSDEAADVSSSIRPFLGSCNSGTLTSFSLKGTIPSQLLERILATAPGSITTLDLRYWPYGAFGLSSLEREPPEAPDAKFFPNLESLRIAEVPSIDFPQQPSIRSVRALVSFLSRRMEHTEAHVRLRLLEVTKGEHFSNLFPDRELEDLRKKGLERDCLGKHFDGGVVRHIPVYSSNLTEEE